MDYIWHTELLNFLATGDYPEGLSRDEKRNYRRKAKSFETKGDKTLFYIQGYRSLIFRCNLCSQRRKNPAYYLSHQHCLPHLTLSGKRKLYVATIEGILIVFLFKNFNHLFIHFHLRKLFSTWQYTVMRVCTRLYTSAPVACWEWVILFWGSFYFVTDSSK